MQESGRGFPLTRWSAIVAASSADVAERRVGCERFARVYWKPLYIYLKLKHRLTSADAQDFTQAFLEQLWSSELLKAFDPARGRLRTYLRVCIDRMVANDYRARHAQKRGGDVEHLSLDFSGADALLASADSSSEDADGRFEAEWRRSILEVALQITRDHFAKAERDKDFEIFESYSLSDEELSYADLASRYQLPVTTITNRLAAVRRYLRTAVLAELRALAVNEPDYRHDVVQVLGVEMS